MNNEHYTLNNDLNLRCKGYNKSIPNVYWGTHKTVEQVNGCMIQGYNARKVNCSCVYSACILKPVLSGRNL